MRIAFKEDKDKSIIAVLIDASPIDGNMYSCYSINKGHFQLHKTYIESLPYCNKEDYLNTYKTLTDFGYRFDVTPLDDERALTILAHINIGNCEKCFFHNCDYDSKFIHCGLFGEPIDTDKKTGFYNRCKSCRETDSKDTIVI